MLAVWLAGGNGKVASGQSPSDEGLFNEEKLSEFKEYVADYVTHDRVDADLTLGSVEWDEIWHHQNQLKTMIYVDTVSTVLPCTLRLEISRSGKIRDFQVEGISEEVLLSRMRYAVMSFSGNIFDRKVLKESGLSVVEIPLEIPLAGNYVIAETPMCMYGLDTCTLTGSVHGAYSILKSMPKLLKSGVLAGNARYSYLITTTGEVIDFQIQENNLQPRSVLTEYVENRSYWPDRGRFRGLGKRMDWVPAKFDGQYFPVRVEVCYDFENREYGWRCYRVSPSEERSLLGQLEAQNR